MLSLVCLYFARKNFSKIPLQCTGGSCEDCQIRISTFFTKLGVCCFKPAVNFHGENISTLVGKIFSRTLSEYSAEDFQFS